MAHIAAIPAEVAADRPAGAEAAGCGARHVAADLDDDLQGRPGREGEEERRQQVARGVPADPRAEDRGRAGDERQAGEPEERRRSRLAGAAIPRPSVTLWTMNPITRNPPSWSSPVANDVPIASPSPRLWTPIPIATSSASASPVTPAFPRERRADRNVIPSALAASPSRTSPGPPNAAGQRGLEVERLEQRLDAEERQETGRERHERCQPLGSRAAQRGQPEEAERDGDDPDEHADQPVAEEAGRSGSGVRRAAGTSVVVWIPVELVTPIAIGSSSTHAYGTTIVLERSRSSVAGPSSV